MVGHVFKSRTVQLVSFLQHIFVLNLQHLKKPIPAVFKQKKTKTSSTHVSFSLSFCIWFSSLSIYTRTCTAHWCIPVDSSSKFNTPKSIISFLSFFLHVFIFVFGFVYLLFNFIRQARKPSQILFENESEKKKNAKSIQKNSICNLFVLFLLTGLSDILTWILQSNERMHFLLLLLSYL